VIYVIPNSRSSCYSFRVSLAPKFNLSFWNFEKPCCLFALEKEIASDMAYRYIWLKKKMIWVKKKFQENIAYRYNVRRLNARKLCLIWIYKIWKDTSLLDPRIKLRKVSPTVKKTPIIFYAKDMLVFSTFVLSNSWTSKNI
jgi:hypothetical protein